MKPEKYFTVKKFQQWFVAKLSEWTWITQLMHIIVSVIPLQLKGLVIAHEITLHLAAQAHPSQLRG